MTKERVRAKDSELGKLHQMYIGYLADKLEGTKTKVELSAADHTGIRGILKDNNIIVEPDVDNEVEHRKSITLTLVDKEVSTHDILGAAGIG